MKIETWPISKLKENPYNARGIKTKDFERLKRQIKKHGIYKPLLVNEDGLVIGGNMRLKAYQDLGITEVDVSIVSAKTEAEILALGLSDNDRAGYYEEQDFAELIQEYGMEIGLDDYKIDLGDALSLTDVLNRFGPDIEEDEEPEVSEGEPVSKYGEVYQLGRHRLMCGDATKLEDVEKLMDGQKADMVFTDPPYGISVDASYGWSTYNKAKEIGRSQGYDQVIGDDKPFNYQQYAWINAKEEFWWGADYYVDTLPNYGKDGNFIVWDKRIDSYKNMMGNEFELLWSKKRHRKEVLRILWVGAFGTESEDIKKRVHPTQKPTRVFTPILKQYSEEGWVILDLFGGSGSTLIACEQTNRTCYMMELDPKYCDVIRKRYENFVAKNNV